MSEGAVCPHCFRNYLKDNGCHYIFACGLTAQGFEVNKGCGRSFCSQCNKKFCSQQYDSRTGVKSETYLDHHDNVCCRKEIGFKEEDYCPGNHNSHCSKRCKKNLLKFFKEKKIYIIKEKNKLLNLMLNFLDTFNADAHVTIERHIITSNINTKRKSPTPLINAIEKKINVSELPLEILIDQEWPSEPTYLQALNSHPYDWRVKFNAQLHLYYVCYDETKSHTSKHNLSASTWVKKYFHHFEDEEDAILDRIVKSKQNPKYFGMTKQEIKALWQKDNDKGSRKGTFYHLLLENHCNGYDLAGSKYSHLVPAQQYLRWRKNVFDPEFTEFRTEIRFHSSIDLKIVGTADLIAIRKNHPPPEKTNGILTLSIFDWKNTKDLQFRNKFHEKRSGLGPCRSILDCNFGHYCVQQNIYKWMLETFYNQWTYNGLKYTSVKVEKMQLIVVHENNKDNEVNAVDVPVYSDIIDQMVAERRKELKKLIMAEEKKLNEQTKMKVRKKRILHRFHPYKRFTTLKLQKKDAFKTLLFPHQEFCCDWMERRRNSKETRVIINALPTGQGKTFTVLMHACCIGGRTLVICPDTLVSHHKNELTKHFYHFKNIQIISFSQFAKMNDKSNKEVFLKMYKTLIVDEIHLIGKKTKLSYNLSLLRCHFVIGLSATPDHDCPLFDGIDEIKDIYNPKTISCFKKIEIKRICYTMTQEEKNACNATITEQHSQLTKKKNLKSATKQCNVIREWCSNARVDLLLRYLQENQFATKKIKIVIFSEFVSTLITLCIQIPKALRLKLDTTVKPENRTEMISKFQNNADIKFLLCTRKIAGIGIDLGFVDIMIMAEPVYDVRETVQMIGRLQRIGQTPQNLEQQHVLEFMYANSCEEQIANSKAPMNESTILSFFKSLHCKQ